MIPHREPVLRCALAAALAFPLFLVAGCVIAAPTEAAAPAAPAEPKEPAEAASSEDGLAAYRATADRQSRNYDRAQDISPRQLLLLLEVSERTGADLGQALATGEFESAHTWNDFVRPSLGGGKLGSATGVWQFLPATFHAIVKRFGTDLLAASGGDPASGRQPMDLGAGPFSDGKVRSLIRETVDGSRGIDDEELQLLRHNFAVLAFAKHYLSVDSGASTPEEDALCHLLGASQARQILRLAGGAARDTLSVKPVEPESPGSDITQQLFSDEGSITVRNASGTLSVEIPIASRPARYSSPEPESPPPVSSEWGLPADSPVVTNNPGMFYKDPKARTQPYTWAEFMTHLSRRVKAKRQPAMVRAKYGVGFPLKGGDTPERAFNPKKRPEAAAFKHTDAGSAHLAEKLLFAPLNRDETRWYRQRLSELVARGDDSPTEAVPPKALAALRHLGMLPQSVEDVSASGSEVKKAIHQFRRKVGKEKPDDPGHFDLLMPAERVALEIYDQRVARYAAMQGVQQASIAHAPDLNRIKERPAWQRRHAAPHVAALQRALVAQELLKPPRKKTVWRDKKGRKRVKYKTLSFAGKVDGKTIAALSTYQLSKGLRNTEGVLDAVSLRLLGLAPMGPEIFLPPEGPQCANDGGAKPVCLCETPLENARWRAIEGHFGPVPQGSGGGVLARVLESDCEGIPPNYPDSHLYCALR